MEQSKEEYNMVYQWKIPVFPVDAQAAGAEIERIGRQTGKITPETVLEQSRGAEAVLHGCFDWNDASAAEKYRREQARDIINNLVTVTVHGAQTETPVRVFVNIQNEYKSIEEVSVNSDYTDDMLKAALKELVSFKQKYATLKALSGVFAQIDSLTAQEENA
jgi:uncharacterized protein YejL (UPF0352 family)